MKPIFGRGGGGGEGVHDTHVGHNGARATRGGAHDTRGDHEGACNAHEHHAERWCNWALRTRHQGRHVADDRDKKRRGGATGASRTRKRGEARGGRPGRGGEWAAKTV